MNTAGVSDQSLRQLIEAAEPPCISVYVPVGEDASERDQARIRLKNQINSAEEALRERGVPGNEISALLAPLRTFLTSKPLIAGGAATLALFRAPGVFESLEVPATSVEISVVSEAFYVKPLLRLATDNRRYRLLALSQNEVRLYEGDRYGFREVKPPQLPESLADALGDDDSQRPLQWHTEAQPVDGERAAMFHGQALGQEDTKERILRFCQLVDSAVTHYWGDQRVPLILAASEPLPGIYRQASHYRNLHSAVISGDPRQQREDALHKQAWQLLADDVNRARTVALNQFEEGMSKGRGTTNPVDALAAAHQGRVGTLLVGDAQGPDGAGQPNQGPGLPAPLRLDPSVEEHVNRVVVETLRHGGRALAVSPETLPSEVAIGALYRY